MTPSFKALIVKAAAARRQVKKKQPAGGTGRALAVGTAGGVAGGVAGGAMVAGLVGRMVKKEIGKAKTELAGKVSAFGRLGLMQKIKFLINKR